MTKQEKKLFFDLCSLNNGMGILSDKELKRYATPTVLGQLFVNRVAAVAYANLKAQGVLGAVDREFRNSLKSVYDQNVMKNSSYFKCVEYLTDILKGCEGKYAMLKGALLCRLYPLGHRTSNDIDLLVSDGDVTLIGDVLSKHGFKQGNIRNGEFKAATRQEIIESKMLRGETVPYIKEINLSGMKYLEVDINFSLDYKNGDPNILKSMISRAKTITVDGLSIVTLDEPDFFIHLCGHLYKEATTLPWIRTKRDMTLYKYLDISMLLQRFSEKTLSKIFERATEIGMAEQCAAVIIWTEDLLPCGNKAALDRALTCIKGKKALLYTVFSPQEKKTYEYKERDIVKRFFSNDRIKMMGSVDDETA